ncbi:hypothetical protein Gpo141_00014662, partial [Globisporangium polare]
SFAKWRKDVQLLVEQALLQQLPGIPECGVSFWNNPTILDLDPKEADELVGVYVAQQSPAFFGSITISKTSANGLSVRAGKLSGELELVFDLGESTGKVFLLGRGSSPSLQVFSKNPSGKYELDLGVLFAQQ